MWKEYAEEIKRNIFLHITDANSIFHPKIIKAGLKTRPIDEEGVLKTNKMYQMRIGDIKPFILKWVKDNKETQVSSEDLPEILGINDRMIFFQSDPKTKWLIYNNKYSYWEHKTWDINWVNNDEYLVFAVFKDMEEVEKNTKEKERLAAKQLSESKARLNSLIIKDNLIAAFKDAGFNLISYDSGKTFYIANNDPNTRYATSYNEFIEKAIEFYVNNGIAKELGCKIHICKVPRRNGYREPYDKIIDLEHIDINGDQDGYQET